MKILDTDIEPYIIIVKGILVASLTYCIDFFYVGGVNLLFIKFPTIREYLLDIKDIFTTLTVVLVFIITVYKLKKEIKNKK